MNEETLFEQALSRPPGERAAFLEQACAGRPELLAAVGALLDAHDKPANPLDRPPAELDQTDWTLPDPSPPTGDFAPEPDGTPPSTRTANFRTPVAEAIVAGRYTLVEKIGEGGMGEVWVAKQSEPVKRKVALKLIKPGMDSRAVLQRFEQERQALALMEHPNIARVIDGGMTADHRPFFVMELVNGLPMTAFCDQAKLGIKERLDLFATICQAVQHAHQKGIIHRDLKPTNILVTIIDGKPVPKVIDFGVAKATSGKLTDESLSTQFGAVVGTLEYMSPEQAGFSGEDIDTRADIYSLGVILYELLTGLRPIDAKRLKKAAFTEMIRMIKEEDPSKPSTRLSTDDSAPSMAALRHTEPKKLAALLRGELDWVVMKCLEKHRDRRYETASGLARDVRRYLDNEVVEARPPSAGYRIGKFVSRHKVQVAAAGLVLLALLAGIAGTTYGLFREARANAELARANDDLTRSRAAVQQRYDLAVDAIKTFHTGVSEDFLLKEDKFKALRNRLLKSASDFYGKLGALLGKETDLASRRALTDSNFELAELTDKVGRKEDALAAHRAVLAAREALASEPGANLQTKADLGRSLTEVASLLDSTGKTDEALATYRRSESLLAGLGGSNARARAALAACRTRMAQLLSLENKRAEALAVCEQARADQEALAAAHGAPIDARRDLAATVDRIGQLLRMDGQLLAAEAEFRRALAIFQGLADEDPTPTELRNSLAGCHLHLGGLLYWIGKPAEAEVEYRTALAINQQLADENPAVTLFRRDVANTREWLGGMLLPSAGRLTEAEAECRAGIAIMQKLVDENPSVTGFRSLLSVGHMNLGALQLQTGKPLEAEAEYRAAVAILEKLSDENPTVTRFRHDLSYTLHYLGDLLRSVGRLAESKGVFERAIALNGVQGQPAPKTLEDRYMLVSTFRRRGLALRDLGDVSRAAADIRRALSLCDGLPLRSGWDLFTKACCHATLAGLAGRAGSGISAAEGQAESTKAMQWLNRAVAAGYRNANELQIDSALDPLRDRDDFKALMAELEKGPTALPEKKP